MCGFSLFDWPSRPPTLPAIHPLCPRQGDVAFGVPMSLIAPLNFLLWMVCSIGTWWWKLSLGDVPLVTPEP